MRFLPYILLVIVLLVAGGIYIDATKHETRIPLKPKAVEPKSTNQASGQQTSTAAGVLQDFGPAPEFTGIDTWLNSESLTLASLRGKVVLVDFWTYSCINCIRTLPYITRWYDTYKDKGFIVIGVHTPEFTFEKKTENVKTAINRHKIHYPVAQDNQYGTWMAYRNRYWPAKYLINQDGRIVYTHFGEGAYEETEQAIRALLKMNDGSTQLAAAPALRQAAKLETNIDKLVKTPEIYFGLNRITQLAKDQTPTPREIFYTLPVELAPNTFALAGTWQFDLEKATLTKGSGKIKLRFNAAKVYMVAANQTPAELKIKIDGKQVNKLIVSSSELYTIFDSDVYKERIIEIDIPGPGFEAFTFTFG